MKAKTMVLIISLLLLSTLLPFIQWDRINPADDDCPGYVNAEDYDGVYNSIILEDYEGNELDEILTFQYDEYCEYIGPVKELPLYEQIVHNKIYSQPQESFQMPYLQIVNNQLINWEPPTGELTINSDEGSLSLIDIVGNFAVYDNNTHFEIAEEDNDIKIIKKSNIQKLTNSLEVYQLDYASLDTSGQNLFFYGFGLNRIQEGNSSYRINSIRILGKYNIQNNTFEYTQTHNRYNSKYSIVSTPPGSEEIYGAIKLGRENVLQRISFSSGEVEEIYRTEETITQLYHLEEQILIRNSERKIIDPTSGSVVSRFLNVITLNENYILRFNPEVRSQFYLSDLIAPVVLLISFIIVLSIVTKLGK